MTWPFTRTQQQPLPVEQFTFADGAGEVVVIHSLKLVIVNLSMGSAHEQTKMTVQLEPLEAHLAELGYAMQVFA
jgi:hypothetical protein